MTNTATRQSGIDFESILQAILAADTESGIKWIRQGVEFKCRCRNHHDQDPSCRVRRGDDGRALINCDVCGYSHSRQVYEALVKDVGLWNNSRTNGKKQSQPKARNTKSMTNKKTQQNRKSPKNNNTQNINFETFYQLNQIPQCFEFFKNEYGLSGCIPDYWRYMDHPKFGPGIVYRFSSIDGSTSIKYKSIQRDPKGKRTTRFLQGNATESFCYHIGESDTHILVSGEEKYLAAVSAGYSVLMPASGEQLLSDGLIHLIINQINPRKVIITNDNDATGEKTNIGIAEQLDEADFSGDIFTVNWDGNSKDGADLNDILIDGGIDYLREFLSKSVQYESKIQPFETWTLEKLAQYEPPTNENILGDNIIAAGELTLLVGQPDIGKSRTAVQLAFDIVCNRGHWIEGLEIHRSDIKILIVQTENNARRCRADFMCQAKGCSISQVKAINNQIEIFIPKDTLDTNLSVDSSENTNRLCKTIRRFKPDLLVLDPYGDFFSGENENDATQTRRTIKAIMKVAKSHSSKTAVLLVHHARSGREAAAGAVGWDSSAFARGSKALMSIARAQINIAPGDEEGKSLLIACGKNNNGSKFEPFRVRLNQDSLRYERDMDFDVEEWKQEIKEKPRKTGPAPKVTMTTIKLILNEKPLLFGDFKKQIMEVAGCGVTTAKKAIGDYMDQGLIYNVSGLYKVTEKTGKDDTNVS